MKLSPSCDTNYPDVDPVNWDLFWEEMGTRKDRTAARAILGRGLAGSVKHEVSW